MVRVLVLEDEETLQKAIGRHLRRHGVDVVACGTVEAALDAMAEAPVHAALLDLWLPDGRGLDLLEQLPEGTPRPRTIVMTGEASVDTAVNAMRLGVVDYLLKPFSMPALDAALARVIAHPATERVAVADDRGAAQRWRARHAPEMLGDEPSMLRVFDALERVAPTDCSVLVHGETGTGKELVARAVHGASGRGHRPFVAVNCAAVPEQLMESELFGHGKGAYTGATERRIGRFQAADGGTLFLDEIGEMPLALQAKLLRALQEKEITPLGENKATPIDVRVVAATHRDLDELVREGKFREDLLYRLDVFRVELPSLRERRRDIPQLVDSLVRRMAEKRGVGVTGVDASAMDALVSYAWPGNVRQLQNVLERAVLMRGRGAITIEDLPERITSALTTGVHAVPGGSTASASLPEDGLDLREVVEQLESTLIRQALTRTGWNKNRAAALLRLNRTTLVEKLKKRGWLDEAGDAGEAPAAPRRLSVAR